MRLFAKAILTCCVTMHTVMAHAVMDYIDIYKNGGNLNINQDTSFNRNSILKGTTLYITNPVMITNYGNINAYINVCDGCDVFIRNSGVFNITNTNVPTGNLFQIIISPDDITQIGFNGSYSIIADGQYTLSMSKLLNVAQSADQLILNNSVLEMDSGDIKTANVSVKLVGDTSVIVSSVNVLKSGSVLQNISGDGTVTLFVPDVDNLHAIQSYIVDGNVYGRVIRETDYYKILHNNTGVFLNNLRDVMPDDKLLRALDSAETMADLDSIMNRSVRLHPIKLMQPVRVMREHDIMDFRHNIASDMYASSFAMESEYFDMYGVNAGFRISGTDNMVIGVNGYVATGLVDDDINEYEMIAYGGRAHITYDDGRFIVGGDIGATIADFNVGPTLTGDNPRGIMIYGAMHGGYMFNISDQITFMPFIGFNGDITRVAAEHEFNNAINTGFEINIHTNYIGIGYDYGIRTMIDSGGAVGAMAHIGIDMLDDSVLLDLSTGFIRDDYTTSFRGAAMIRVMF